ncbi:MAG: hypothetical protein GXP08_16585 [Gammaproteobacteria bacterium]|nr:hypothetical protein [Gammaproteobacteria bacterium]
MTEERSVSAPRVKYPFSIAMFIIVIVIFIVWLNQKDNAATDSSLLSISPEAGMVAEPSATTPGNFQLKAPSAVTGAGRNTPNIVENMNRNRMAGSVGAVSAPGLGGLLSGLEDKVKSEPGNINNRLLLAQTYNELGLQDKALVELRDMWRENPEHVRVNLVLASILSQSDDQETLKESLALLDKVEEAKDIQPYLVYLYRGEALIRAQDHQGALASWEKALKTMPASDNRRTVLEKRIADINAGGGGVRSEVNAIN